MRRTKINLVNLLCYVFVILALVFFLFPIFWMGLTSLKTRFQLFAYPPRVFFKPTLSNYLYVFFGPDKIPQFVFNSLIIAIGSTGICIVLGLMAGYSIARSKSKHREAIAYGILSTRMIPAVTLVVPLYLMLSRIEMLDTHIGLILAYTTFNLPFVIWLMRGFFLEIPIELEECAKLDGCSMIGALFRITIPLAIPGIAAASIFCLFFSWNEFFFALILTGLNSKTIPVTIGGFITTQALRWGKIAATAAVAILPAMILASMGQKYIIRGLTKGAIK